MHFGRFPADSDRIAPQYLLHSSVRPVSFSEFGNLVAQMEDVEGGVRSYRIQRTTPDGLSYARDIAARYGLNLQEICQNA